MVSTNRALAFRGKQFGSSGRTRTYNPSVNSRIRGLVPLFAYSER